MDPGQILHQTAPVTWRGTDGLDRYGTVSYALYRKTAQGEVAQYYMVRPRGSKKDELIACWDLDVDYSRDKQWSEKRRKRGLPVGGARVAPAAPRLTR